MKCFILSIIIYVFPWEFQRCEAQNFLDSCFGTVSIGTSFNSSDVIVNFNSDLIVWTGLDWEGDWPQANIDTPLPYAKRGCKAIWMGQDSAWTVGGEGIGLKLQEPLQEGISYTFTFTYISHGIYSDGAFAPIIATGDNSNFNLANFLGQLEPAGYQWLTSDFSFTANEVNSGNEWLFLHTGSLSSPGIVMSECIDCFNFENYCDVDLGNDTSICPGDFILLNAYVPGATYEWNSGITLPEVVADQAGDYIVNVTLPDCRTTDSIHIDIAEVPLFNLADEFLFCHGESVTLAVPEGFEYYEWTNGSTESYLEVFLPGVYGVTVFNEKCSAFDDTAVIIDNQCDETVVFPNVFTPNEDTKNELFKPLVFLSNDALEITIYNRWGKIVHHSIDPLHGWDGVCQGKASTEGTYYFVFKYLSYNQNLKNIAGSFQLMR